MPWEHFFHEADIGVRGRGGTLAEAFEQAAIALTAVVTDPALVGDRVGIDVTCEAPDNEVLLVDWLNVIVGEMSMRGMLFSRFHVVIEDNHLRAALWGEPVDRARHQPAVEVKGATYTCLQVQQCETGEWIAQTVVDV